MGAWDGFADCGLGLNQQLSGQAKTRPYLFSCHGEVIPNGLSKLMSLVWMESL